VLECSVLIFITGQNSSRLSTYEFTGLMPPMHNNEEVRVVIDQVENLPLMRTWTDSAAVGALVLTSYRIIFSSVAAAANTNVNENTSFFFSIPLRSIQTVRREKTVSDRKALTVFCKDTRVYSLLFRDPAVDIQALFQIFSEATTEPMQSCFAYSYLTASFDDAVPNGWLVYDANEELQRLGIGESAVGLNFRISHGNKKIGSVGVAYVLRSKRVLLGHPDLPKRICGPQGRFRCRLCQLRKVSLKRPCTGNQKRSVPFFLLIYFNIFRS